MTTQANCHPDKPLLAKGLCSSCYSKTRKDYHKKYAQKPEEKARKAKWNQENSDYHKRYQKSAKYKKKQKQYHSSEHAKSKRKLRESTSTFKERYSINYKIRYKNDPIFKLSAILRARIHCALKRQELNKQQSVIKTLGCTLLEFKNHIETLWQPGMTWENHKHDGWHIDHIKPLSSFDLTDPEQFKQANHYTNLQPLWAFDNISKHNKATK
jgi:hypothetical protein